MSRKDIEKLLPKEIKDESDCPYGNYCSFYEDGFNDCHTTTLDELVMKEATTNEVIDVILHVHLREDNIRTTNMLALALQSKFVILKKGEK